MGGYTPPFPPCTPSLRTAPRSQDRDRDLQLLINKPGHHLSSLCGQSSLKSNFVSENERNEEASGVVHAATRSTVEGSEGVRIPSASILAISLTLALPRPCPFSVPTVLSLHL